MTDRCRTDRLSSAWIVLGCALAFSISFSLTEHIRFNFQPGYLLPFLVAWIAGRAGKRIVAFMLLLTGIGVFNIHFHTDATRLSFGFSSNVYHVSLMTSYAFAYPRTAASSIRWLQLWWRYALGAMLCVLALAGLPHLGWHVEINGNFDSVWKIGVVFTLLVALTALSWPRLASQLRPLISPLLDSSLNRLRLHGDGRTSWYPIIYKIRYNSSLQDKYFTNAIFPVT